MLCTLSAALLGTTMAVAATPGSGASLVGGRMDRHTQARSGVLILVSGVAFSTVLGVVFYFRTDLNPRWPPSPG